MFVFCLFGMAIFCEPVCTRRDDPEPCGPLTATEPKSGHPSILVAFLFVCLFCVCFFVRNLFSLCNTARLAKQQISVRPVAKPNNFHIGYDVSKRF